MKYLDPLLLIYSLFLTCIFLVLGLTHAINTNTFISTLLFLPLTLTLLHDALTWVKQALTSPTQRINSTIPPTSNRSKNESLPSAHAFKTFFQHQPRIFFLTSALYLVLLSFFIYKLATINQSDLVSPVPIQASTTSH